MCSFEPSASTTQIPQSSFLIAAKTICVPSGDQLGQKSLPRSPLEILRTLVPSGRIV
jgi:hypothetical protein